MSPEKTEKGGGLSLQTLIVSSLSAVAAAVVVPTFWEQGSLFATAATPVIVALVSEALKRPAAAISTAAPRVARRTATGVAVRTRQPTGVGARGEGPERVRGRGDGGAQDGVSPADPFGLRERPRRRLPVRIAVVTGLLAAVIGAAVVTVSELAIFKHSVGASGERTSLFGGTTHKSKSGESSSKSPSPSPSQGKTNQRATPAPTATPSPGARSTHTPTPTPPAASATPQPSASATPSATP
jgi:hypothetical protein